MIGNDAGELREEVWAKAVRETDRLCYELDITNADHIVLWLEHQLNGHVGPLAYIACRILDAHEAAMAGPDTTPASAGVLAEAAKALMARWPTDQHEGSPLYDEACALRQALSTTATPASDTGAYRDLVKRLRSNERTQVTLISKLPAGSLEKEAARNAADAFAAALKELEGWPADGTCRICGSAPRNNQGLCSACADERLPANDAHTPASDGVMAREPFGYWVEQKHAEPLLLRKPAYIPEPSDLRTVTPLYATPSGAAVPTGWALVPVEPTQAMLDVTCDTAADDEQMRNQWAAMLAASPKVANPTPDRFGEGYRAGLEASAKVAESAPHRENYVHCLRQDIAKLIRALQPATGDEA